MSFRIFSCNKCNPSQKSSFLLLNNYPPKEQDRNNKEQLLISNDNNNSSNSLEIIDYPYNSNNNDDKTVKMSSNHKNIINKNNNNLNNISCQSFSGEEQSDNMNFFKNLFVQNSSNNSSVIINNDDNITQNKKVLNNYYNNRNENENNNQTKDETNNKKIQYGISNSMIGIKIEYPCCDKELLISKINQKLFKSRLIKRSSKNTTLIPQIIRNLKKNKSIKNNRTLQNKNNTAKKYELLDLNYSHTAMSKNSSKMYDTFKLYENKNFNKMKDQKILKGKIYKILNRKIDIIKSRKIINKNKLFKKHKIMDRIASTKSNIINHDFSLMNKTKKKYLYASNINFISSLLNKTNNTSINIKNTISINNSKVGLKRKNPDNILKNKKIYKNPFSNSEKNHHKKFRIKLLGAKCSTIKVK